MDWISRHKTALRLAVFFLLLIGLLGPWIYEPLLVPNNAKCLLPAVRIRPGICGQPMSGLFVMSYFGAGFFTVLGALIGGSRSFAAAGRELAMALVFLPLIPLFSSLLLIWQSRKRVLQAFHWTALVLSTGLAAWFIAAEVPSVVSLHTWGPWLFLAALLIGLAVETGAAVRFKPKTASTPAILPG